MSDSSRDYDSSGSLKGLKKRLQTRQGSDTVKKSLNHFSDIKKNMEGALQNMFSGKSESSVYSKGVRELDDFGYEKYNLEDDGGEIFISKVPERAIFNDGEPIMVRATGGNFVGSADNTSVCFDVEEAQNKAEDVRSLFSNVPRGTSVETEYHATVGEVTAEGTVKPRPIDNSFMGRLKNPAPVDRRVQEDVVDDNVSEAPMVEQVSQTFIQIDDDEDSPAVEVPGTRDVEVPEVQAEVAAEIPAEAPAEEPVVENRYSFLDRVSGSRHVKASEFFVDEVTEEPAEAPVEEAEEDDYSWISFGDDVPQEDIPAEEVAAEIPAEAPVEEIPVIQVPVIEEVPVEEPVVEAPVMEEPVEDEVPEMQVFEPVVEQVTEDIIEDVPVMDVPEEVPTLDIEPAEEIEMFAAEPEPDVAEDVSVVGAVEAPVEDIVEEAPVEAPAEPVIEEAPVEEPGVVMTLPGITEIEPLERIEGIEMEGSEPSVVSAAADDLSAPVEPQVAETSAAVEPAPATRRFNGMDEDGEALPPLSDPVVKRPRTVRFRFSNGVLQNVDPDSKAEPREELHSPLD